MGNANITPFLASEKLGFTIAIKSAALLGDCFNAVDCRRHVQLNRLLRAREMTWATKRR
jgi:hypothetical protein